MIKIKKTALNSLQSYSIDIVLQSNNDKIEIDRIISYMIDNLIDTEPIFNECMDFLDLIYKNIRSTIE